MSPVAAANPTRTASPFPLPVCSKTRDLVVGVVRGRALHRLPRVVARVAFDEDQLVVRTHAREPSDERVDVAGLVSRRNDHRNGWGFRPRGLERPSDGDVEHRKHPEARKRCQPPVDDVTEDGNPHRDQHPGLAGDELESGQGQQVGQVRWRDPVVLGALGLEAEGPRHAKKRLPQAAVVDHHEPRPGGAQLVNVLEHGLNVGLDMERAVQHHAIGLEPDGSRFREDGFVGSETRVRRRLIRGLPTRVHAIHQQRGTRFHFQDRRIGGREERDVPGDRL